MNDIRVIAINPGSTSTKIAVYQNTEPIFLKTIRHSAEELAPFQRITDQFQFRKDIIIQQIQEADIDTHIVRAVMGRGGLLKPIASGVYEVNDVMIHDLQHRTFREHASNLGGLIAHDLLTYLEDAKAYIADPIVVDELDDIARIAGHPLFERISIFHALNQKAIARDFAKTIQRKYEELNLIVVHMGGGITVGAHQRGRVIDVNQGLDGEGPFSPERSGTLPVGELITMCFEGKYTEAYQVAKYIGEMFTVLKGDVNAILITGGIAYNKLFVSWIQERVYRLAPVHIFPGEDEMRALAMNGFLVIKGEITPKEYF